MAKASLRTATPAQAGEAVTPEVIKQTDEVLATGVEVESITTVAPPSEGENFDSALGIAEPGKASAPPAGTPGVTVPAVTQPAGAVSRYSDASDGSLEGEWSSSDLKFPTVKIVQGSGPLSEKYPVGSFILGEEILLPAATNPQNPSQALRFVPLKLKKAFRENLTQEEYAAGQMPQIVQTIAEVESLGGTTQWIGKQKPSWSPCASSLLLLEAPADTEHPGFAITVGEKNYAVAAYYMTGGAFNSAAKNIFNNYLTLLQVPVMDGDKEKRDAKGFLVRRPYMPKRFWTMRIVRKKSGDFNVFVPEVRLTNEDTSAELRNVIDQILSAGQTETPVEE